MLRAISLILASLLLAACSGGGQPAPAQRKTYTAPPAMKIDVNKQYFAVIKTDLGDIRVELFPKEAPNTVNNFVFLAREKFYDGVKFHRIIRTFMVQTGDPRGDGTGGPGYKFNDELPVKRPYEKGIVAMANAGPNTQGSQFFICTGEKCNNLNRVPNYTIFGKVSAGMDVLDKIAATPVAVSPNGEMSKPTKDVFIKTILIEER